MIPILLITIQLIVNVSLCQIIEAPFTKTMLIVLSIYWSLQLLAEAFLWYTKVFHREIYDYAKTKVDEQIKEEKSRD